MKKVIGLGSVFFKGQKPKEMYEWYEKHLGIKSESWGATFPWKRVESDEETYSAWSIFSKDTKYLAPSEKDLMVNYQVHDMDNLPKEFNKQDIEILGTETSVFGKFAWIMNPENKKIELCEAPKK